MVERIIRISDSRYERCPTCGGRGVITCTTCNGTGRDPHDIFGPIVGRPRLCPTCGGKRIMTCPTCKGTGKVRID